MISKILLLVHEQVTYEDTTIPLRMVKDKIGRVGGTYKFPIMRSQLVSVKDAVTKHEAVRIVKQKATWNMRKLPQQESTVKGMTNKQISEIDD